MENTIIGIAGLGLLGRGIAACLLAHGMRVFAYTPAAAEFVAARASIARAIDELIEHAGFHPALRDTWQGRFTELDSPLGLAPCSFVIESIVEDAEAKMKLFAVLEQVLSNDTPIASNTSALPISQLQQECRQPERVLGMHWAEPAHATRFLELIRGDATGDAAMHSAMDLARQLGKDPCLVQKDVPGFLANRMAYAMYREACHLLASGVADAATIDRSFRNSVGLWASVCGPFQWIDLTGGPALYAKAMAGVLPHLSTETAPSEPLCSSMERGDTGVRSGRGIYRYTQEQAHAAEERYRRQAWRVYAIGTDCEPPQEPGDRLTSFNR